MSWPVQSVAENVERQNKATGRPQKRNQGWERTYQSSKIPGASMVRAARSNSEVPILPCPPPRWESEGRRSQDSAHAQVPAGKPSDTAGQTTNSRQHALPPPAFRHPPGHGVSTRLTPITPLSARSIFTPPPSPGGFSDQLPTLIPSEHPRPEIAHVHQFGRPHPRGPTC